MSCDSEFRNFEASFNSNVINGGYHEDSRISYSRESLLFLAKLDASKTLPSGFDCSIFSELNDACKSSPDDYKSPRLEWTGRISGNSSRDSAERWDFCKLSSKESRSIDSEKPISNQSQHSWQNPGNNDSVGSLQDAERSFSKQSYVGSEVSTSKLQGTDTCQLSRCNHPYRPPSFYKAMNHSGANNHDHSSKGTSAECPSKERLMEGSWRKDTCVGLEENSSALSCNENPPLLPPADNGSIELPCSSGKAPENHLTEESSVSCPSMQDLVVQQLSSQCQLVLVNSGVVIDDAVEELQGKILDGGRFSALISLEEVEDVDAYFVDEANLASNDCSRDGQNVKQGNVEFKYTEKKELISHAVNSTKSEDSKDHEDTLVNSLGKTACNISAVGLSRSSSYFTPYKASNSQLAFETKDWKCIVTAAKDFHKTYDPLTQVSDCSEVRAPQLPPYTKKNDNIVNGKGSCRSGSRFIHWFPENADDSKFNISSEVNEEGWVVWGVTNGKSKKEKLSGQGLLQEVSTYCENNAFCEKTSSDVPEVYSAGIISPSQNLQEHKLDNTDGNKDLNLLPGEAYGLQIAEEADACLEFNLPDEDSLITFDDTYIWDQDASKPSCGSLSPVSGSNKSMRLENVQSLSLAHPWFHESDMNTRSPLVNPPNSMPHVKTLSGFHDPWEHSTNDYTPTLSVVSPHSLPLKPRKHEPSDNCCPDLDNILSADPSMYHQFLQTPCRNQDPCIINFPLSQASAKSMDVEIRGLLADKSNNSTVSQFLQMQRMLAQLNIEAIEQRVYQTSSHLFQ